MKQESYSIYDLAMSMLSDKLGISEKTYLVLVELLRKKFDNQEVLSNLLSQVETVSGRYYISYSKGVEGDVYVSDSSIEGEGLFANKDLNIGELLFEAANLKLIKQSPSFSFVNHSSDPSCYMASVDNDLSVGYVSPKREIKKGEEITIDYKSLPFVDPWIRDFIYSDEQTHEEEEKESITEEKED
jgi:hypothetical protein|tara:strand:- start:4951 stop:5508 length:558 start_codon:yes stop_codon:yes gene_type:complete